MAWKEHKNSCRVQEKAQQLSLVDIHRRVQAAAVSGDWDGVLSWESRIEELVAGQHHGVHLNVLGAFAAGFSRRNMHAKAADMFVRCSESCSALKMFDDEVEFIAKAGHAFSDGRDLTNAARWLERARDASSELGFKLKECEMCMELGKIFSGNGRREEGVEQQRRALAVVRSADAGGAKCQRQRKNQVKHTGRPSNQNADRPGLERAALRELLEALCLSQRVGDREDVEEAETVLLRLHELGGNTEERLMWHHLLRGLIQETRDDYTGSSDAFQAALQVAGKHPELLDDPRAKEALDKAKFRLANSRQIGDAICHKVMDAWAAQDWAGVLGMESAVEEMLASRWMPPAERGTFCTMSDEDHDKLLLAIAQANLNLRNLSRSATLLERRLQVLGNMERFAEQAAVMCTIGDCFLGMNDSERAAAWFQKARSLGEKHGCYQARGP